MLRHAEQLLNRFQLQSDNKTSFHRRWGTAYNNSVLPFGELVLAQDQTLAIWLGRCEASDEHILATATSSTLVKSPSVTRMSLASSMHILLFSRISLPAPELASVAYLKMAELGEQSSEKAGGARELRLEYRPQAYTKHPQPKANGQQSRAFQSPCELTSGRAHSVVLDPPSRRQPSEEQASQQQPVKRCQKQNGSTKIANKLHRILEKARTFQEIELAVTSEEESWNHIQQYRMHSFKLPSKITSACFQQRRSRKRNKKKVRA